MTDEDDIPINHCSEHPCPFCVNSECTYDSGYILLEGAEGYKKGLEEIKRKG